MKFCFHCGSDKVWSTMWTPLCKCGSDESMMIEYYCDDCEKTMYINPEEVNL
jgi:hypothetical protein